MTKIVYGVFDDPDAAERAVETLESHRVPNVVLHTGHVREEEVQIGGTRALSGMITGGLVVGVIGALLSGFVVWPMAGYWFGWSEMLVMVVVGSIFGVVAGGVAGASECKPELQQTVREVDRKGGVLVTYELDPKEDAEAIIDALQARGAEVVRAA